MILAAGRGERMGEITQKIPKPLTKIGHMTLLEQVPHSLVQLALLGGSIIYASTKPFEFNPQNGYNANPESLEGIRDTPGMLVVEKCNFTPKVEMAHGRIAMTAFTILCLIELISGKPFFG